MRLVMTIPFRNHRHLIGENLAFHASRGIDAFVLIDHLSQDGSREIVEEYRKKLEIFLIEKNDEVFRDGEWRTEMAFVARNKLHGDWVISNDVDEFWVAKKANIKSILEKSGKNVVYSRRKNFVPYTSLEDASLISPPRKFYYLVSSPVEDDQELYEKYNHILEAIPAEKIILKTEIGKAACALDGLISIDHGSHEIDIKNRNKMISEDLLIYHYPFDTKKRFMNDIEQKIKSVLGNPKVKGFQDYHVKRWRLLMKKGLMKNELKGLFPGKNKVSKWIKEGIVTKDTTIYDYFLNSQK